MNWVTYRFLNPAGLYSFTSLAICTEQDSLIITHQPQFAEWVQVFGDRKNDHSTFRSHYSSLRNFRNRQRFLTDLNNEKKGGLKTNNPMP